MTKKNIMPVVVLTVICVVVALLLALVNSFTDDVIEEAQQEAIRESLQSVMPSDWVVEEVALDESTPKSVTKIYKEKNGLGYAVTLSAQGYASKIAMTLTIDADGKVIKAEITSEQETHGQGGFDEFMSGLGGKDYEALGDSSLKVSHATLTSNAIKNGIRDALVATGFAEEKGRSCEEILGYVSEYVSGEFEDVTPPDSPSVVQKIYREKSSGAFVAYVLTVGQYVPIESEGVVAFDSDGKILGVKLINWVVGGNGAANSTDSFVESFKDKYASGLTDENMVFVTDVTRSCKNFRDAIKAAVETATSIKTDSDILALVSEYIKGEFEDITPLDAPSTLKKLYREKNGKGYVAYVMTLGQYVPIESEGVVAFDSDGKILGVELINWVVGGAGAANSTDSFVESFNGKTSKELTDENMVFVTDVTRSCKNFRDAVVAAGEAIPKAPVARIVGITVLVVSFIAVAALIIVKRRKTV
ncbi:MAG: FMN-binding protein [Clostridia bacterium]|nr:FMN-binding protein [Clostridia bacterium]